MRIGSRKRLGVGAIALATASIVFYTFTTITRLHDHLLERGAKLQVSSYKGSELTRQDGSANETSIKQEIAGNTTFSNPPISYIKAILDPTDKQFDRLQCPGLTPHRYDYLLVDNDRAANITSPQIRYFFALNLRQCIGVLPRLVGSIVETVRFLGPKNCALSIVEGNSDDGTLEILEALRKDLDSLGLEYHLQTSDINPKNGDRIEALAALRNLALEPLVSTNSSRYSPDAAVIFLNDVAICMDDILELLHQRIYQKADMVCAMDWSDIEPAPIFYDIWIARAINGDTFWEIPRDGSWRFASNLFWNHATTRRRYDEHKPFQVFACWNGGVVFGAKPLVQNKIRFRNSLPGECVSGEPRLFCKDLWMEGYSRIAVVPSVNLEYSDKSAKKVKALHGYVSDAVKEEGDGSSLRIRWEDDPPAMVKCMAEFSDHSWVPWNQRFEDVKTGMTNLSSGL